MDPPLCRPVPIIDFDELLLHSSSPEIKVVIEKDLGAACCQSRSGRRVDSPVSSLSRCGDVKVSSDGKSILSEDPALLVNERKKFTAEVMASLGPDGPGLLAVRGVPAVTALRRILLPLAKKLALMPDYLSCPILKNHDLCADVPMKRPDRPVSAFATQLRYARYFATVEQNFRNSSILLPHFNKSSSTCCSLTCTVGNRQESLDVDERLVVNKEKGLEHLGSLLRQLGACMVEVGLLVARLCDSAIPGAQLEEAIWESGSAKARLIHYHAQADKQILPKCPLAETKRRSRKLSRIPTTISSEMKTEEASGRTTASATATGRGKSWASSTAADPITVCSADLWQQWHYDYGVFTVLTAPMFLYSREVAHNTLENERRSSPHSGLKLLSCSKGGAEFVSFPGECLIIQVGEVAQIASGGKLAAALHCVCRPPNCPSDLSRETFATFLQPAWHRALSPPMGMTRTEVLNATPSLLQHQKGLVGSAILSDKFLDLFSVVPSLDSRWKEGSTFAEFSRETTAQYYGIRGWQSHKTGAAKGFQNNQLHPRQPP